MLGKGPMLGAGSGSDDMEGKKARQSYPGKGKMGPDGNKEKTAKAPAGAKSFEFLNGGGNKMIQNTAAAEQTAGQSASSNKGDATGGFGKGGNGKMFHSGHGANPAEAGTSSPHEEGTGAKFAEGGKGHMFGPQTACPAVPGRSSAANG
jgi:hypothetical protein